MSMFNYLKYSGIWLGVVVNPYHWRFGIRDYDPGAIFFGPFWIRVVIDNGKES